MQPPRSPKFPAFFEFVALIAGLMAISSLSIDNLLPAFGPITKEFGIASENEVQLILYIYMISFSFMQLVYGPIADRFGRRVTVLCGLLIYFFGSALATFASSFALLLLARVVQGFGAASSRTVAAAIVRDHYSGREMARVMSFTMLIFIMVPMFAPSIGSIFLHLGSWRTIFASMLGSSALVIVWFGLRMPETLHPNHRRPISVHTVTASLHQIVTTRVSIGYATAQGLMFGCVMGYVGSADQIFQTNVYKLGDRFPVIFALIALGQAGAAVFNASLVRRLGTRRISHSALAGFIVIAACQLALALSTGGRPPLGLFCGLLMTGFFLFGLTAANFNAMAMEPLGTIAGTASAFIGCYMTLLGAGIGLIVGQSFNGTVLPLVTGFLALSVSSFLILLWTERGRLFTPQQQPHAPAPALAHGRFESSPSAE